MGNVTDTDRKRVALRLGHRLAQQVLDCVFPRDCVHCHEAVDATDYRFICQRCVQLIVRAVDPRCPTCGYPYWGQVMGPRVCHHCEHLNPVFKEGRTLWIHRDVARTIMHYWKYRHGRFLDHDIRQALREDTTLPAYLKNKVIVPVPLHSKRQRQRGFNQSQRLAEMLLNLEPSTRIEPLLWRTRETPSQTHFDRKGRLKNIEGAFALKEDARIDPETHYLVVDDVFTTGATLDACCRALRKGGAEELTVFTLAHG